MAAAKRLVASTPQGSLRLLGTGGTYALRSHTQIRQYLRASLGEDFARLFAEPSFDNANNRIDWLAEVDEQPVPLTPLPAEQADALRKQLAEKRQRIAELSETLAASLTMAELGDLASPSLFSSTRCIVVRGLEDLPEESAPGLLDYAASPADDVALVLVHGGGPKGSGLLGKLRKLASVTDLKSAPLTARERTLLLDLLAKIS